MNDTQRRIMDWESRGAELDEKMALFESQYKHVKPCKRYMETGYCTHLANAQQRKFGKDTNALIGDLVDIAKK